MNLTRTCEETGAEVLRGALRYPSESSGWQLGDIDLSGHLAGYRDYNLAIAIIARPGTQNWVLNPASICGIIAV